MGSCALENLDPLPVLCLRHWDSLSPSLPAKHKILPRLWLLLKKRIWTLSRACLVRLLQYPHLTQLWRGHWSPNGRLQRCRRLELELASKLLRTMTSPDVRIYTMNHHGFKPLQWIWRSTLCNLADIATCHCLFMRSHQQLLCIIDQILCTCKHT